MSRTDTILRARNNDGLSLDEMRRSLPSIFAEQPYESLSKRYVFIPTIDTIQALMQAGFVPHEARMSRTRSEGKQGYAKHMIRFRNTTTAFAERKVGDVSFEVILRTSHDGSSTYDFMAGLLRLLCLNGMVVSDGNIVSVHVRHSGNRERILQNVVEGAQAVLQTAPLALEAPRKWSGIELSSEEQMVFADSARTIRFGDAEGNVSSPIETRQLLNPRRPDDMGNDLWRVFQRIQENIIRGGLSAYGQNANGQWRRSTTREVRGIDGDVKLNRALWQLADQMARIKLGEQPLVV